MPTFGGKESRGKIITVKPYEQEGDDRLLWLTERQRGLLLAFTEYLDWKTRWAELPSPFDDDDYRDAYVSGLKNRLMVVVEFCAEVINCIDTDEDTRNAIGNIISNFTGNSGFFPIGESLPLEELERDMVVGSNPTCDSVILGRQCSALVRYFDDANTQFFQELAVSANALELANQIADLPFINLITRNAGIQSAVDFVLYMVNAVKEQYEAGVDPEYLDELAKQLYCLCYEDCKITLDRFFQMTAENINELIPTNVSEALGTLVDILEIFTGLDTVGTDTADLMFWLDGILAKVVSVISFGVSNRAIDFLLYSAATDSSFNLDLTGLDCGWTSEMDVTADDYTWVANPDGFNWGNWTLGEGFVSGYDDSDGNSYNMVQIRLEFAAPVHIYKMEFEYDVTVGIQDEGAPLVVGTDNLFVDQTGTITSGTGLIFNRVLDDPAANQIALRCQAGFDAANVADPGGVAKVKRIKVWGFGTKPAELP